MIVTDEIKPHFHCFDEHIMIKRKPYFFATKVMLAKYAKVYFVLVFWQLVLVFIFSCQVSCCLLYLCGKIIVAKHLIVKKWN